MWFVKANSGNRFQAIGVAVAALAVAKLLRTYYRWWTSPLRKLPSPSKSRNFLFGTFWDIQKEAFMEPHKRWLKEFGWEKNSLPFVYYTTVLGSANVLVLDCDIVKEMLTSPSSSENVRFPKRIKFLAGLLGDGLLTLEGSDWSRHRRIIQPSFQVHVLRDALNEHVPLAVSVLIDAWKRAPGREIDVSSHLSALTLDIIGRVAFLYEFKALDLVTAWSHNTEQDELGQVSDPLITSLNETLRADPRRILFSVLGLGGLDPGFRSTKKHLNAAVDKLIANNKMDRAHTAPKSLVQLLFLATDHEDDNRTLSHVELRDEAKTFLVAGHETTSTWCYWACFALAKYPEIQERVFQDIVKECPDGPITIEAADRMEYLNGFLQEVLRLYPPVGILSRYTAKEEVLAGCRIPANTRLTYAPHLLHRHPRYWPDPDTFDPERWTKKAEIPGGRSHHFAFIPFSAGGRNCIGQRFATIEALLMMGPLVRAFRVQLAPSQRETEFRFTNYIVMKAKPHLKICVSPRDEPGPAAAAVAT